MSRIHEAIKKAEMERNSAASADGAPNAARTSVAEPEQRRSLPGIGTDIAPPPSVTLPKAGEPFRFADLHMNCNHVQWNPDPRMNVFSSAHNPQATEQFRTLRSRLYQLRGSQPLRTLLVTSSLAAEGKTFVTSNLSWSFVRQAERRALIIDGDLRCSRLHVPLGAPSSPGLTDYLRGDADEMAVIQNNGESNLHFIAGGTNVDDPSELLSNGRLKTLLQRVAPAFDWVIFDSPPCLPVADANVLADFCDGLLLVVKAGADAIGNRAARVPGTSGPKRSRCGA